MTSDTQDADGRQDALRGPWLAVLADRHGFVYESVQDAIENVEDPDDEMSIAVVRGTAVPNDRNGTTGCRLRQPGSYHSGDMAYELDDVYLNEPDDDSIGVPARFAQAQAMAAGLNAAATRTGHEPVWMPTPDEDGNPRHIVGSCSCGAQPPDEEDSVAWFGSHLEGTGAPDYMLTYWEHWADHIEASTGQISRDAVARELFDYGVVMGEASKVYEEMAGLSKPNTAAQHIIAGAEGKFAETYADYLCDHIHGFEVGGQTSVTLDELREIAEGWHPGSWAEHVEGKDRVAKMREQRTAGQEG